MGFLDILPTKESSNLSVLVLGTLVVYVLYTVYQLLSDPLRRIPGPWPTRFTRFWELAQVRKGHFEAVNIDLHKTYGPIVRLAPNRYSINDASAVKAMYGHGTKFIKAPFYHSFGNPDPDKSDMFNEREPQAHALKRRKVASLYSMTTLLSYEAFVDHANAELCDHLSKFCEQQESFHVPQWMQYYAFDVIGEITVGESFGFMEHGKDHNGILGAIHEGSVYGSRVGLFPEVHPILGRLTSTLKLAIPFDVVIGFINRQVDARRTGSQFSDRSDFLTKLMELREKDKIEDLDIITTVGANIAAGSDTTAIALGTFIYMLLKHPEVTKRLQAEIDDFAAAGKISDPVRYQESQQMPYLQAVIKEVLRIHPATGQPLSRIVPPEGATLAGQYFPGGTSVGTSAWIMHFNKDVFGQDASEFKPERWMGNKEDMSMMEQNFLSFGQGSRTCIGKNISLLEISKVVPQLYRRFNFRLADGMTDWNTDSVWFVKQDYRCLVERR